HGAQHRLHLEGGEGRAEAAADAASEGDPAVGGRVGPEKALRLELQGVLVEIIVCMDEADRGHDRYSGREPPAADLHGRLEYPCDVEDHGSNTEDLLDDRVEVLVLPGG